MKAPLSSSDLDQLNRDLEDLHKAISKWSFAKLWRAFLFVAQVDADFQRQAFFQAVKQGFEPQREVTLIAGDNVLLDDFKSLKIHEVRNNCIHHNANRPKAKQLSALLEEARRLILGDMELFSDWDATDMLIR